MASSNFGLQEPGINNISYSIQSSWAAVLVVAWLTLSSRSECCPTRIGTRHSTLQAPASNTTGSRLPTSSGLVQSHNSGQFGVEPYQNPDDGVSEILVNLHVLLWLSAPDFVKFSHCQSFKIFIISYLLHCNRFRYKTILIKVKYHSLTYAGSIQKYNFTTVDITGKKKHDDLAVQYESPPVLKWHTQETHASQQFNSPDQHDFLNDNHKQLRYPHKVTRGGPAVFRGWCCLQYLRDTWPQQIYHAGVEVAPAGQHC
jgi:hypothetical protein